MSSQGKGSAVVATTVVGLVCLLSVVNFKVAQACTTYIVGGNDTYWSVPTVHWPKGKVFKAGDKLVFLYDAETNNVVVVNKAEYRNCTAPDNAPTYNSGNDTITLVKGHHFFICTFFDHCLSGLKIAVKAV